MGLREETEHCLRRGESREMGGEVCEALDHVGYYVVMGTHYSFLFGLVK